MWLMHTNGQIDKPSKNAQMLFLHRTHQVPGKKQTSKQTDYSKSVCGCVCVHTRSELYLSYGGHATKDIKTIFHYKSNECMIK